MARSFALESGDEAFMIGSHLPHLPCVSPLPNLSSVAFFSTSRAEQRHGWRPQPPTPARAKMSSKARDAESLSAQPRRPSVSAIPRPARTASTRRASRSCMTTTDVLLSPEKARRPPQIRRSAGVKSDNPPSSYHLPQNLLPRSESFLTQFEEFSSSEDVFDTPTRGLSKSQTAPELLPPGRAITSHRLLRPLDPPLPRSSTYGDIVSSPHKNQPQAPDEQVSLNNTMALNRLEKQRASAKSPYPPRAQNATDGHNELGDTTWSLPSEDSALSSTRGSEKTEVDPRFVFFAQPSTYWLGRYTSLVDQLRTAELVPQLKLTNDHRGANRATTPKHKNSMEFERADRNIKREAMQTLRSFCQTEAAVDGLQSFEKYMSQNDWSFWKHPATARHELVGLSHPPVIRQPSGQYPPVNPAKPKIRKPSDSLPRIPPNIFQRGSNSNKRGPAFSKSFTLGNLRSTDSFSNPGSSHPNQERLATTQHAKELSYHSSSSEMRFHAMQERDARPNFSDRTSHLEDVFQRAPKAPKMPLSENVASIKLNSTTSQHASFEANNHEVVAENGGISQPLEMEVTTKPSPDVNVEDTPSGHSKRFRKSESMKKLFDASIKGIRNMGHRVSNTGGHDGADEFR